MENEVLCGKHSSLTERALFEVQEAMSLFSSEFRPALCLPACSKW